VPNGIVEDPIYVRGLYWLVGRKAKWESWFKKCGFDPPRPEVEEVYERIYLSAKKEKTK